MQMTSFFQTNTIRVILKMSWGSSKLYNGSEWSSRCWSPKRASIHHKKCSTYLQVLIKAFWSDPIPIEWYSSGWRRLSVSSGENMLVLFTAKENQSPLGLYRNPQTFFFTNPHFVLLIGDRCFVLLSPLPTGDYATPYVSRRPLLTLRSRVECFYDGFMHFILLQNFNSHSLA